VVAVGVTVLLAPLPRLCDQLYVLDPLAVNVVLCPLHIVEGLAFTVTLGGLQFGVVKVFVVV